MLRIIRTHQGPYGLANHPPPPYTHPLRGLAFLAICVKCIYDNAKENYVNVNAKLLRQTRTIRENDDDVERGGVGEHGGMPHITLS